MGRTNPYAANNTAAFSQLQAENDALKKGKQGSAPEARANE